MRLPVVDIQRGTGPHGWDETLLEVGGSLFHSLAWGEHASRRDGGEPLFCVWRDPQSGEALGRALAIRRPPSGSLRGRVLAKLSFNSPPAAEANEIDYVVALRSWLEQAPSVVEVALGSFDQRGSWAPGGPPQPFRRYEFMLTPKSSEELKRGLGSSVKDNAKRARRDGVEVRPFEQLDDLRTFAELHRASTEQVFRRKAVAAAAVDVDDFARALEALTARGQGKLYLAERDGEPLAGCFFGTFGDTAVHLYNGASEHSRASRAAPLGMVEAFLDLHAEGFSRINLGGTPAEAASPTSQDHGLYTYKQRFGGDVVHCTSGTLIAHAVRRRAARAAQRLLRR